MRVLVACEFSGVVREAFRRRGHDAWSCDFVASDDGSKYHYQSNVREHLADGWDLMIAHPPCTYLATMGLFWNGPRPERWPLTFEAAAFVEELWQAPITCIALENPQGYLNTRWQPPTQIIHPWQFGHQANKPTCLWLKNVPRLAPTHIVDRGRFYTKKNGMRIAAWSHATSGTNKAARARIASRTFPGIAEAMADQWPMWIDAQQVTEGKLIQQVWL